MARAERDGVRIEAVQRLVEQHELDRADERGGEPDPLAHAERQLAARPLRDLRRARDSSSTASAGGGVGAARLGDEADVLARR